MKKKGGGVREKKGEKIERRRKREKEGENDRKKYRQTEKSTRRER